MRNIINSAAVAFIAMAAVLFAGSALAKDGVIEIKGAVQAMPAGGGYVGAWKIAGRNVQSTAATEIDREEGPLVVGATVEVKGTAGPGDVVLATKIEVQVDAGTPPPPGAGTPPPGGGIDDDMADGDLQGAIDALPPGGTFIGTWKVAGKNVIVLTTTRLDQEHGGFIVGAIVEVNGTPGPDGLIASKVETKSSKQPGAEPEDDGLEINGKIDALPPGAPAVLIGTWKVAGRDVVVTAATRLDTEHGPFVVGGAVQVEGFPLDGGGVQATQIESKAGNGADVPALEFTGKIEALPPVGMVGVWKIGGKNVTVTATTKLDAEDGPFVVGADVKVDGWPQVDGAIEAHEIETLAAVPPAAADVSKVAVEFFNPQLGHFFLTAAKSEIAALDGGAFGGAWKRTGQTLNVGGNVGVCRFYGMPPKGPDSHFFTAEPAECQKVMGDYQAWTFENHAFTITAAVNGTCAAGLVPVRRFYNNPTAGADMNHRYVVSPAVAAQMLAAGWIDEGVVMCAQP
jgi:hypothetical protein